MTGRLTAWLNGLSAVELAVVFCGFFIAISLLGILLVHPLMRRAIHGRGPANDMVISVGANYGLVYAVLLGLLTVGTFESTKNLEDHMGQEASSLSTIYSSSAGYPEPLRSELRFLLRDYTHYVIGKDWPAHRKAHVPVGGEHRLQVIRQKLLSFEPASKTQEMMHSEVLRYLDTMTVARQERLTAVTATIPNVLWYVVIIGAFITIVFLWMLHMDLAPQIMLGGITAFFLGIMTFLIYAMDHPLQGAVSISAEPFETVYEQVMKWDEPT
jgi:hypothetical protein